MALDTRTNRFHFIDLAREAVGAAYLSLPRIVVTSILWSVLAATVVLAAPATTVVVAAADATLSGGKFDSRMAVRTFIRFFWRSQAAFVPFVAVFDVAWWLWTHTDGSLWTELGAFLAVDVLVVYGYLLLYYFPLLVDRDGSAIETARASATLASTRVAASLGLFLFVASIATLFAFTVAGFLLLAPGVLATVVLLGTRYLAGSETDVAAAE